MKKKSSIAIFSAAVFFIALFVRPSPAKAIGLLLPFGGKITSIVPNTLCTDGKPAFFIKPALPIFPPGPYGGTSAAFIKFPKEVIAPGIWVIGLYSQTQLPCMQINPPPAPPTPFPTLPVFIIGTSQIP